MSSHYTNEQSIICTTGSIDILQYWLMDIHFEEFVYTHTPEGQEDLGEDHLGLGRRSRIGRRASLHRHMARMWGRDLDMYDLSLRSILVMQKYVSVIMLWTG